MTVFDAVGFGALNVDKLFRVDRIAVAEEESFVIDYTETCGGSAANTMVGLTRLGSKVGFIGKIASDDGGKRLLEDFRREGVDTGGMAISKSGRSGTVIGFVGRKGERALYIDPGVNDAVEFSETVREYASSAKILHLTSFVGEQSFQTQKKLIQALPESVKLSIDPGALYARKGLPKLTPIMKRAFVSMPNAGELELLTGKDDYRKGAEILLKTGVRVVAVKLGSRGCYVTDGKENCSVKAFKVKVLDTTGAGDAFCAGFLYGLISGQSLGASGRVGNFVASRCIMEMGARAGLPSVMDLAKNDLL